jgi:hypothetical protein
MPVPDFSPGEVLTAAAMDSISGFLVKSQAVGAGAADIVVTGAFSADFDNYKITLSGGTCSGIANFGCIFGATIGSVYSSTRIANSPNSATPAGSATSAGTSFGFFGQGGTDWVNVNCDVFSPFLAKRTIYNGSYMIDIGASSVIGTTQGFLDNNDSYTGFTITFGGQTVTDATLRVYGYRN